MATIPIEIILQDAETPVDPTPTPTPDSGDNTNIVVPDTGAGIAGGNDISSSSSVASIILPATLLVVALVAICTLLIHKHRKRQEDVLSRKEKLATAAYTTVAVLSATVLVGNLLMPATNAATSVEPGTADLEVTDKITITATREADSDAITATVKNTSYATANLDFGYKVSASMAEGTTTANLYLDGNTDSPYYIAPVSDGTLTDNTWGYALSEEAEEYLAIPLADDPDTLKQGKDAVEAEPVDVYYYVKIASDMPAGTYSGELEYSLVALEPSSIGDLTYLQDFSMLSDNMKVNVLKSMAEDQPYYLQDIRDGKSYRIAKLKDGKVWMTQNLDLQAEDIKQGVTLDSDNTDYPSVNFTLPESQKEGSTSWDSTAHVYDIAYSGIIYKYCLDYRGYCSEEGDEIPAPELGNLYNWYTATAGTGTYDVGGGGENPYKAAGSICPAGWRLPNNSNNSEATDYSILLYRYGITESPTSSSYINTDKVAIYKAPLSLVPTGYYANGLGGVGMTGSLWSSLADGRSRARGFGFYPGGVGPWTSNDKPGGYAVRCVAR